MIGQKGLPARSGGIERHVETLASGLASRGHRVIVFGRKWYVGTGAGIPSGVEQILTKGIRTKHLDAITHCFTALWAARALRPDVIHIHGTGPALLSPLARLFHPRAAVIVTFHSIDRVLSKWGSFARLSFRIGEWLACHVPHRTIAVSQTLAGYCQETYGTQTNYVTHPIPMPEQQPLERIEQVLSAHGLKQDQYFLFLGRLIPDKMAHLLVQAYAMAALERPDVIANKPLVLVGAAAWTDRYARWLCGLAAKTPGVVVFGERSGKELQALQAGALAHVFPTASEGLSLAIVEACQFGRLVVATDIPANLEATGGAMLSVRPNDVHSLMNGLIQAAELSYADRAQLAASARAHVAEAHQFDDRLDDLERIYREACGLPLEMVTLSVLA
ncbi:MAG TPA: glycosyltransferase family 4 protein [Verrucomicrobiae bacterium]|nr:glycosyltransferase family 4 protein [Verrucomicrobiae bacterium]